MKTEHLSPQDQKALFIARFFASIVIIVALTVLTLTALYLRELKEQDKRIEYIEDHEAEITPQKIGDLFCSMDNNEMADFFNQLAMNVKEWQHPFVFQMQGLTDAKHLSDGARNIMKQIGEYSSKTY